MAKHEHLKNAPITEAVVDLWVEPVVDDAARFKTFADAIAPQFPHRESRQQLESEFRADKRGVRAANRMRELGLLCRSSDRLDAVQARIDGFSVNRLRPYKDWDSVRAIATTYWPQYVEVAGDTSVRKLGLRYINHFEVVVDGSEDGFGGLSKYLNVRPAEIATFANSETMGFLLRVGLKPAPDIDAVVTVLTMDRVTPDRVPCVLDIEVGCEGKWSHESTELWDTLERLRQAKNDLFFAAITDDLKEMFK